MKKSNFIPLGKLLKKDDGEVKQLKTIYKKEGKYEDILGPIEYSIATFYLENRKLKDIDVIRAIKNIKMNYLKEIEHFKEPLEEEVMFAISESLIDFKITHHEFLLALNYILWSINNRKWMQYSRAYLDWILDFFGMANKKEKERFNKRVDAIGKQLGISKDRLDAMKGNYEVYEETEEDKEFCIENSRYFSMSDSEKCDYFLNCDNEYESSEALNDLLHQIDEYIAMGKFPEAMKIADKIKDVAKIEKGIREVLYSMKIECLVCLRQYDEAEKFIQQLIKINKDYPMPYFNRAIIQFQKKNFQKALEIIDETISIAKKANMKHPQYYAVKARILKEMNDPSYKEFEKIARRYVKKNLAQLKKLYKEQDKDFGRELDGFIS